MSIFDKQRLTDATFKLDVQRMRQGWYTDKYFTNIANMLATLSEQQYHYEGKYHNLPAGVSPEKIACGDLEVEMQWFTRRQGETIVVGIDKSLEMLRLCTGYWEDDTFINTADHLQIEAVHDGCKVCGDGTPDNIQPVLRVRGRYRDFAVLETPTLGILTRASRVATNVYDTFIAARGKPVLFFPARFDLHEAQAADGYAYNIALQRFNLDYSSTLGPFISTDAQGDWWGGAGGGTVSHSAIACFFGDTAEAMLAFARVVPLPISRIALVDFNNDCIRDSLRVCKAMFDEYIRLLEAGQPEEAERFKLYGVRMDTGKNLRDASVSPLGDPELDLGVNPRLVFILRQALDAAWESWSVAPRWRETAQQFCKAVKIVVSGGFNPERIRRFERLMVPADIYAVGSSLFDNHGSTVADFTADVVRVKVDEQWIDLAKVGRHACDNPDLEAVIWK